MTDEQSPDFIPVTPSEDGRSMHFGIRPDELGVAEFGNSRPSGLAILLEAAAHFSSPFVAADVSDEEIEQRVSAIFGEEPAEVTEGLEEAAEEEIVRLDEFEGPYWFTSIEFSLQLPLRPVDEEGEFWFFPLRGDGVTARKKKYSFGRPWPWLEPTRPKVARTEHLAAELDVRSTHWRAALQTSVVLTEGQGEPHLFLLALPQLLTDNWQACRHRSTDRPSAAAQLLQGPSETLLVLFDSLPPASRTASWKQPRPTVGEYRWRSLDRGRRWLDEVAKHLGEQRAAPRGEVGAVLWLADPQVPAGSRGAAALVPVPERLQPARDHWQQLTELWQSTLRDLIAREIHDACRQ
ncbi:hypothetical protein ACFV2N_18120 [Streptomyces sp. NPDC059680]|uniref:hypothetical protein n=1 Tax=Streptomyces sp. NPDC059680 TaxID=3346904 RepID=UPI003692F824